MVCCCVLFAGLAGGQTAQVGADAATRADDSLRVDYLLYKPARWENVHVKEYESEHPNLGGFLCFYLTNVSDKPVDLRFWRYNGRDESYWVLNHFVAWHRLYDRRLDPGRTTVLEINATTRDFGPEVPMTFGLVDGTWEPCLAYQGTLTQDALTVSFIRVMPGLRDLEIHLRHAGTEPLAFEDVQVLGHAVETVTWRGQALATSGQAIAHVRLAEPVPSASLLVVRVTAKRGDQERAVYAHRRAFADLFPIGTWGMEPDHRKFLAADHVDTGVRGGKRDDEFFGNVEARRGMRAMVHTGEPVNVDMVRDLSGHPAVACWMLRDEPDWSTPANIMLFCDETVRAYDNTIPTFLNLCRNTKFFEYAPIADIPGHDHYCVSAPSSSVWPHPYGTRLEETAYYTADLKYASEPKPVWVWSQGNHDGWSERPDRPLPTPEELSAQLVLNLGRGAKGILWFTYNDTMSKAYPETRESMRGWNRVMNVLREELLASEPSWSSSPKAPENIDVAPLVGWDTLILCITNLDYKIDPKAYPFNVRKDVEVSVALPDWLVPASALAVTGRGVEVLDVTTDRGRALVSIPALLDATMVVLSNDRGAQADYEGRFKELLSKEKP